MSTRITAESEPVARRFSAAILDALRLVRVGAARPLRQVIVGQVCQAVALIGLLISGRRLLDMLTQGTGNLSLRAVAPWLVGVGCALAAHGSLGVWIREARVLVSEHTSRHIHRQIIDVTTAVDYQEFEVPDFHDRLSRAQERATQNVYGLVYGLLSIIEGIIGLVAVTVVLIRTMPELLVGLAAIGAPLLIVAVTAARLSYRVQYELTTDDRRRRYLQNTLVGAGAAKEIRLFDLGQPLTRRWTALADDRVDRMEQLRGRRVRLAVLGNALAATAAMAALAGLVLRARWGSVSAADTAVAALAFQQMASRLRSLSDGAGSVRLNAFVLDDFRHFVELLPTSPTSEPEPLPPLERLDLDNLAFRYPGTDRRVLEGIDLQLEPGRVVALVGANGSGKSTLAKLLCGLYKPTTGTIRWNGEPLDDCSRLAASVTAIHQDFVRYELTADENIAISRLDELTDLDAAIVEAADRSGALEFLDELPEGRTSTLNRAYDGGADLSGGQWQRVALARTLFDHAPVVVLDEPTSALDAVAERQLFETMRASFADRAIVLISHRFSSVRDADEICVLDGGLIVERGSHDQLIEEDGRYAQLFAAQVAAFFSNQPVATRPPVRAARADT